MEETKKATDETSEVETAEEVKTEVQTLETEVATYDETKEEKAEEMADISLSEKIELAEKHHAKSNAHAKMNLPNKLSLLRIALVPIMVVLFYMYTPLTLALSVVVFIIASITDFLDGYIARKNNIVTDFGKFIDPIADKLLVITAMVLIMSSNIVVISYVAEISLIIVIAREFAISGLRLVASNNGKVIAADKLGKIKTVTQIVAIILLLTTNALYINIYYMYMLGASIENWTLTFLQVMGYVGTGIYIISTIICVISGISYLVKNKEVFTLSK